MSNVLVDKSKIDILANAISNKSGEPVTMTLDEMVEAVDEIELYREPNLQEKTFTVDTAGTNSITADDGYDGLSSVEISVPELYGVLVEPSYYYNYYQGKRRFFISAGAANTSGTGGWVFEDQYWEYRGTTFFEIVPKNTAITPTESAQTIGGSNYMMEGAVTVNAIPSNYVGSGITQRSSNDLTVSGATVTVPSGYYSSQATKSVASGTAGTPTATKGTVSNHSISVTPSVTNTTGYITGSTKSGTAVTVTAAELVSGTVSITSSGNTDVTNYATASVASGSATASATKGAVSNHSVTVTPSVTRTAGYVTAGSANGTAVTVSASELVSGSETKTANGTYDVTNLASLTVAVPIVTYYTGSSAPSSSLGSDGDIYLQTQGS